MVVQRSALAKIPAYVQGKSAPGAVKLSSNENPYPPLPSVQQAIRELADTAHLYPDMGAQQLIARLAERNGVRPEEIVLGAGSVESLAQLINASAGEGDEVVFAWRSFEAYPILTIAAGAVPVQVPLTDDERHDLDAMAAAITDRTRLILVCSPNNPTGTIVTTAELDAFMSRVPKNVLVVVDQAYVHFDTNPDSADGLDFFRRYDNIAVLHTFSKAYGLAGLRVGYAIARPEVATNLRKVSLAFGVTNFAQRAAIASLDAEQELQQRVDLITAERTRVRRALLDAGWTCEESFGNFVWLRTGERTPAIDETLREQGVIARAYGAEGVRITIGSESMNDAFLRAIETVDPS